MLDAFVHASPFHELAALLALAALVGIVGQVLRQPLIVAFMATGVIAGPAVLGIVRSHEHIELLAELGIAVLLFLVGLKLDLQTVRSLGPIAVATGLGQVAFTSLIGFVIGLALGLDAVTSTYVAIALTFSSTIIIVKLLTDKREVDSLHGRIAIGFLIVQDFVVVIAMIALSSLAAGTGEGGGGEAGGFGRIVTVIGYGIGAVLVVLAFIRYVADPLVRRLARLPELLVTFSIAWAALAATVGKELGFSMELGGLLAGISLASTPYREVLVARLASLRDFLLLFFFVALGAKLDLSLLGAQIVPALVLSAFVLIGNPLIVLAIMGAMGYRKRTGFLAGLTVAQISEFSLIFIAMGYTIGHVSMETTGLVTLVGIITISLSVYMMTYSNGLYRRLEPMLGVFERRVPYREEQAERQGMRRRSHDVVVFGSGRLGSGIADRLRERGTAILLVDFDPEAVRHWRARGIDAIYGDACDPEFLAELPLTGVRWVVAALPHYESGLTHGDPRLMLLDGLRSRGFEGRVAVAANRTGDAEVLRARGADVVFLPFEDAADRAVGLMTEPEDAGDAGATVDASGPAVDPPAGRG